MQKVGIFSLSGLFFVGLLTTSVYGSEIDVKPGLWEWSTTMEVVGMPFAPPPVTYRSCITEQEFVPQDSKSSDCKMITNKTTRSGVEWKIECGNDGSKSVSVGKMTYSGTKAKGRIEISAQGMQMISNINGHRVGECK